MNALLNKLMNEYRLLKLVSILNDSLGLAGTSKPKNYCPHETFPNSLGLNL